MELDLLPFDEYVRSLNRKRMSAGVLFYDADGRVLLVEPSYKPHWDIPGGTVDAEEAPWTTAIREAREELGWTRPLGRLLVVDYVPTDEQMPEGIAFIMDGGKVTGHEIEQLKISDPEILSIALLPLDDAVAKVSPVLAKRLAVALEVARTDGVALCDNGKRVA